MGNDAGWSRTQMGGFIRTVYQIDNSAQISREQFEKMKRIFLNKQSYDQAIFDNQEGPK